MTTVFGVFRSDDEAIEAAARGRDAAGRGAAVRVLLRSQPDRVVTTSVTWDRSAWTRVVWLGLAIGLFGAIVLLGVSARWSLGLVGLSVGLLAGAMLGVWRTGAELRRVPLEGAERWTRLVRGGRPVVLVTLRAPSSAERVARVLEEAGGIVRGEPVETEQPPLNH
jgi:hypothetical protein